MSRHLSTRNISSKSLHAFWSNLANRQTRTNAFTSSFVGGKKRWIMATLIASNDYTYYIVAARNGTKDKVVSL